MPDGIVVERRETQEKHSLISIAPGLGRLFHRKFQTFLDDINKQSSTYNIGSKKKLLSFFEDLETKKPKLIKRNFQDDFEFVPFSGKQEEKILKPNLPITLDADLAKKLKAALLHNLGNALQGISVKSTPEVTKIVEILKSEKILELETDQEGNIQFKSLMPSHI